MTQKIRTNLYKLTGQNDKESFVLAKNIQDASSMYAPMEGCGAEMVGLDSIKKVELINDFEITDLAFDKMKKDLEK